MSDQVIIFGGSSGVGEETARQFARAGSAVCIVGRDPARLEAARARLPEGVVAKATDARDRGAVRALFAELGPYHHLVLCVTGRKGGGPFRQLSLDELRTGMEDKLFAQLMVAQAGLETIAEGGSITFVSASSARSALPGTAGLAALNAAIEGVVRPLAVELAPLRVNAVSPGVIDTAWWDGMPAAVKQATFEHVAKSLPVRRIGAAGDVAAAIVMVATNRFMTGTVVEVDGGGRLVG